MLAHAAWVGRLTHDDGLQDAITRKGITHPGLGDADRAMLAYVEKLTLRPGTVEREDVEALRAAGFSDQAIGDVAINAALFAFMNRVVDGLGGRLDVDGMVENAQRYGYPLHPGTY
ncbi:MAG: hypothetical protein AAB295_08025 [Chloroflexota bacterium]